MSDPTVWTRVASMSRRDRLECVLALAAVILVVLVPFVALVMVR